MKEYTKEKIQAFTNNLSTLDCFKFTNSDLKKIKDFVKADGCTGVPDFYICSCIVHDFFYETHKDFFGNPITKAEADKIFKKLIQHKSLFGIFSPMSYWRWAGVKLFGGKAWNT